MISSHSFADRREAGQLLAEKLKEKQWDSSLIVVGLPRGGVRLAAEVARGLRAPLDVCVVRKLGAPYNPEFAIGAIASGGVEVLDRETIESLGISPAELERLRQEQHRFLAMREKGLRPYRSGLSLRKRTVLLVDDGLATGWTMRAAVQSVRRQGAGRVCVAIPVSSAEALASLREEVDDAVCLMTPKHFLSVGQWYSDFRPVEDSEVIEILKEFGTGADASAQEGA